MSFRSMNTFHQSSQDDNDMDTTISHDSSAKGKLVSVLELELVFECALSLAFMYHRLIKYLYLHA